jgi:nucleoside-diphosphate-sugar epimerase
MNVTITGATGFFGHALLQVALRQADLVRALVRRPADDTRLRALGAHTIRGDLSAPGGCRGLVEPGDIVVHAAARVELVGRWPEFQRGTVDITRHLLDAALPQKPACFVYVSSAAVYSPNAATPLMGADHTPTRPTPDNLYGRAKLVAERLVQRRCDEAGCPWTIVRLAFLYGPRNQTLLDRLEVLHARGRLCLVGDGQNRIATLYNDDAAAAVWAAATHPAGARKVYDAASAERVTQEQFVNAHAALLGLPPLRQRIPRPVAYAAGWVAEFVSVLAGRQPAISRCTARLMGTDQVVDASRLQAETGWCPRVSFTDGMERTRAWWCDRTAAVRQPLHWPAQLAGGKESA